jgi:hypothetical protein
MDHYYLLHVLRDCTQKARERAGAMMWTMWVSTRHGRHKPVSYVIVQPICSRPPSGATCPSLVVTNQLLILLLFFLFPSSSSDT